MSIVFASLTLSAPVTYTGGHPIAVNSSETSTFSNFNGDTCLIESMSCTVDADCRGNGVNHAGEPSSCACYYSPDGIYSIPCEGSNRMPLQTCECHPIKVGFNHNCVSNQDCLSGNCDMGGLGDHGCAP